MKKESLEDKNLPVRKVTLDTTNSFFSVLLEIGGEEGTTTQYYLDDEEVKWLSDVLKDFLDMRNKNRGVVISEYKRTN